MSRRGLKAEAMAHIGPAFEVISVRVASRMHCKRCGFYWTAMEQCAPCGHQKDWISIGNEVHVTTQKKPLPRRRRS